MVLKTTCVRELSSFRTRYIEGGRSMFKTEKENVGATHSLDEAKEVLNFTHEA